MHAKTSSNKQLSQASMLKLTITLSLLLNLLTTTMAQTTDSTTSSTGNSEIYDGLVLGIGKGTLAVCAFGIVGLVICFFKDCTATPSIMVALGIAIPLLVLLIVWFLPKKSLDTDTTKEDKLPTNAFRVRTGVFSALIFLVCLLMSLIMCGGKMTTLTGQKVDSEQSNSKKKSLRLNNAQRGIDQEEQAAMINEDDQNDMSRIGGGDAGESQGLIQKDEESQPINHGYNEEISGIGNDRLIGGENYDIGDHPQFMGLHPIQNDHGISGGMGYGNMGGRPSFGAGGDDGEDNEFDFDKHEHDQF